MQAASQQVKASLPYQIRHVVRYYGVTVSWWPDGTAAPNPPTVMQGQ